MQPTYATSAVVRPWERELYKGCRRAWDFTARSRGNWEPAAPVFDFAQAVRDALAVYYFPGMWDWNRAIVRPLATEAFVKAMRKQLAECREAAILTPELEAHWEGNLDAGRRILEGYYEWAAEVDRFSAVQVESLFDVTVPDPAEPSQGLLTADGRGIAYRVRIDLVVVDEHELYWLVDHHVVTGNWPGLDHLLLDEQILSRSWAWELGFLARVTGTIHNELRLPAPGEAAPRSHHAADVDVFERGGRLIRQQNDGPFRRTQIPRHRAEIENIGARIAVELREMSRPDLSLYPTPLEEHCRECRFRRPCIAMNVGDDPGPILDEDYRPRTTPDFEEGRLGSVWGFVPHRPDQTHVRLTPPSPAPPPPPGPPD